MSTHRRASTQDFQNGTLEFTSQGLGTGLASNIQDLIHAQVTVVLDVLFLLAVTGGLLEGLDDQASGRGLEFDGGDTVGDGQLDADTQALVFKGGLGDVVLDLLGGDTEGTDLLSQSVTSTFTTDSADEDCIVGMGMGIRWGMGY